MKIIDKLHLYADVDGLRALIATLESKYPGASIGYMSSYGMNMDITIELPVGTTVTLPQIVDATGRVEE